MCTAFSFMETCTWILFLTTTTDQSTFLSRFLKTLQYFFLLAGTYQFIHNADCNMQKCLVNFFCQAEHDAKL